MKSKKATQVKVRSSENDTDKAIHLLATAYKRLGSWEKVADWYDGRYSPAYYYRIVEDNAFAPSVYFVRLIIAKNLPPDKRTYNADTHRVVPKTKAGKPRKEYWRPCLPASLRDTYTTADIIAILTASIDDCF